MRVALLNLISTPAAVLPRLGLQLSMGLSSEDPIVGRRGSEPYEIYLSVYASDGSLAKRLALGRIGPRRRRLLDVSFLVQPFKFDDNHLVVAHRVPASLVERYQMVDEPVVVSQVPDYSYFRSYVQYGYPGSGGAHGSVVYEVPHRFNEPGSGVRPPVVFTFTTKIVLSPMVTTCIVLINYSTDPHYATTAEYQFAVYTSEGSRVAIGRCVIPPFAVRVIDLGEVIPSEATARACDAQDGLSHFCFYGICENASVAVLVLNLAPSLGGVSVEHTHPTQAYLLTSVDEKQRIKREAIASWRELMAVPVNQGGK